MKGLTKRFARRTAPLFYASGTLILALIAGQANATSYTLVNNNSTATLNLGSSAGLDSWTVDGVNQVNQQWFWFRVGSSGPQMDLSQITTSPFVTLNGLNQLTTLYSNSTLGVSVQYTLAGQANGSGSSGLTESVRVFNYSSSATLPFNLFLYSDFTLRDPSYASDQYVQMANQVQGLRTNSTAVQSLGGFGVGTNSFVAMTAANRFEAALYNQTLNELTTVNDYDLNRASNAGASAGPGHVTWAMEWQPTIGTNNSFGLSLLDNITQVPEPGVAGLLLVGAGAIWLRRRKGSM